MSAGKDAVMISGLSGRVSETCLVLNVFRRETQSYDASESPSKMRCAGPGYNAMADRTSELWLGNDRVRDEIHTFMGSPHVRVVLCTTCLKGTALQRFRTSDPFSFDPEDILESYSAFEDLNVHAQSCRPVFTSSGVVPVTTRAQAEAVEEMAKWSKLDAGWDTRQCTAELLTRQPDTFSAIAKVDDGQIKGFACFKRIQLTEGEVRALWDLYVFTPYRGEGHGSELVSAGIERFGINRGRFPVSAPVRPAAARIVHRLATDLVLEIGPDGYVPVPRGVFLQHYAGN